VAGTVVCSSCKGEVPAEAERCQHCGSWFGPNRSAETKLRMVGLVVLMLVGVVLVLVLVSVAG